MASAFYAPKRVAIVTSLRWWATPHHAAGEWITASGEWVNDRTHGFRASLPDSADGIEKYLSSGMIRGVGPVYAKKYALLATRCSTSSRQRRMPLIVRHAVLLAF
jgi:hypothetical protein